MFPGQQSGPEPQKMQSPDKPKKKKKNRGWERVFKNIQKDSLQSCATKLFEEGAKISHYHKNKRRKVWKINMVALSSWLMSMELTDNFTADKNSELKMREKSSVLGWSYGTIVKISRYVFDKIKGRGTNIHVKVSGANTKDESNIAVWFYILLLFVSLTHRFCLVSFFFSPFSAFSLFMRYFCTQHTAKPAACKASKTCPGSNNN